MQPADDAPQPNTCAKWHAHYDLQPGTGPHTLHVSAECTFPTAGYQIKLKPAKKGADPGADPDTRGLKKVVRPPQGMAAQVITTIPLAYGEPTNHAYKKVKILPNGPVLVEEVH